MIPTANVLPRSDCGPSPALTRARPALGTLVVVSASGHPPTALAGIERAFARIAVLETLLHPDRPGSELARVNAAQPGQTVPVGSELLEVLRMAQIVHAASDGLFDPCLPERPGRLTDLRLSGASCTCARPVALDLGGIAKGFIVDAALRELEQAGCPSGLVNAGGDLRLFGCPQTIHLRCGTELLALELAAGALAVSEPAQGARPQEHRGYYLRGSAAVDPVRPRDFAAVHAPTAMLADALTKCVLFGSAALIARVLDQFGARQLPTEA